MGWLQAAGPAVASEGATGTVARVRRIAAHYGYRELGRVAELEDVLMGAHQRWLGYRDRVPREGI